MKLCMAQINTLVGDIYVYAQRVSEVSADHREVGDDKVVYP